MTTMPAPPTIAAIWKHYEDEQDDGYRPHLGASIIGNSCSRAIWYSWRWATRRKFEGRMLRLFQTGHLAENRFISDLRAIGATVRDREFSGNQIAVWHESGHFGGSLDGVVSGLPEAPMTEHVLECKTHNAKSFALLQAKGVVQSKPTHDAQMQVYMHFTGLTRAAYFAVNKDTDELHFERVPYDVAVASRLIAKAEQIIASPEPPTRINEKEAWFECRLCDHADTCHHGKLPKPHCRSCLHVTPVAGGLWECRLKEKTLDLAEQKAGCPRHLFIPAMVRGQQVDADLEEGWIKYVMPDGKEWIDGNRD